MKDTTKVRCRWCRKRLYRVWNPINWMDSIHKGKEPLEVRTRHEGTQWELVEGWWGEYGRESLFCSKNCGFRYAVRSLSRDDLR